MFPTLSRKLKHLDLYSRPPRSLSTPTMSGALLSICAIGLTVILLLSELHIYNSFHHKTSHEIKP